MREKRNPAGPAREYWANPANPREAIANGSFYRKSRLGIARYVLGDFWEFVAAVPPGLAYVPAGLAENWLKGK